jgi:hypothetical protein
MQSREFLKKTAMVTLHYFLSFLRALLNNNLPVPMPGKR